MSTGSSVRCNNTDFPISHRYAARVKKVHYWDFSLVGFSPMANIYSVYTNRWHISNIEMQLHHSSSTLLIPFLISTLRETKKAQGSSGDRARPTICYNGIKIVTTEAIIQFDRLHLWWVWPRIEPIAANNRNKSIWTTAKIWNIYCFWLKGEGG